MVNFATLITLALIAPLNEAATRIAVIEYGQGGTVHRSDSRSTTTTVDGVSSLWGNLHSNSRKLQHAGMTIVPDLFSKPDNGIVIGVTGMGVDLESMPFLSSLISRDSKDSVGVMEVAGSRCNALMSNIPDYKDFEFTSIIESVKDNFAKKSLTGIKIVVDSAKAADIDALVASALQEIKLLSNLNGENIIVHVVVDEDEATTSRRTISRRLEDQQQDVAEEDQATSEEDNKVTNGYYGYGYFNEYNEWVTPFKTMHQIQYFNIVLWTSVGLFFTLFFTIYLMVNMPLEADTLLFGESAKFVGDD